MLADTSAHPAAPNPNQLDPSPQHPQETQKQPPLEDISPLQDYSNQGEDQDKKLVISLHDQTPTKQHSPSQQASSDLLPSTPEVTLPHNLPQTQVKPQPAKSALKEHSRTSKHFSCKCWNKLCLARGIKSVKSRVDGRYLLLCPSCWEYYRNGQYCEYCEQIYAQEEVDGMEWIECETKGCGRWNHTLCEKKHSGLAPSNLYFCTKCCDTKEAKDTHRGRGESRKSEDVSENYKKESSQMSCEGKARVFKSFREQFGHLQSMLTSYSYKLSLPDDQIKYDIAVLSNAKEQAGPGVYHPEFHMATKKRKFR